MLKNALIAIAVVLGVVVAAVLGLAASKPDSFRVERSAVIKAPPEKLHALVDNFHAWSGWSPWERLDPGMKRTYAGADSGKGAIYEWQGNDDVGRGRMEITTSTPPTLVEFKLDFSEPFEAHNMGSFTFTPEGGGTRVTWAMWGPQPMMAKVMDLFMGMDAVLGQEFETGLANMRAIAER